MATKFEISCVTPDDSDGDRGIATLGGTSGRQSGGRWKLRLDDAIGGIEAGHWTFWTKVDGKPVNVVVATRDGRKYLECEDEEREPGALLRLPRCP